MQSDNAIPFIEFGGDGPSLHFAHANAYPPACYRQLLGPLSDTFQVWAIEQRPLWSDQSLQALRNWRLFALDLIQALEQKGHKRVIGAGHSLGAVVTMMAAFERPDLFQALVLIEPVLLPPSLLEAARAHPEQAANTPMVQRARKRRNHWPDRRQAFDRFRGKSVFQRLTDEALWDYVNFALVEAPEGGVMLRFPRDWEAHIYSHPPTAIWNIIPHLTHPTLAIRGIHSETLQPEAWERWRSMQPAAQFVEIAGSGHLVPMEQPERVGQVLREFLSTVSLTGTPRPQAPG